MKRFSAHPSTLSELPLFALCGDSSMTRALPALKQAHYPARRTILRPGDDSGGLYMILSGRVLLVNRRAEGSALIAAALGAGECFGVFGLFEEYEECPTSIEADEATDVVFVPPRALQECLTASPRATLWLLEMVATRLRAAHGKLAWVALADVQDRVAAVLLEHGREADGQWHVAAGAEQIARIAGCSREMVTRVVGAWIDRRLVRRHRRKLIVVNRTALAGEIKQALARS